MFGLLKVYNSPRSAAWEATCVFRLIPDSIKKQFPKLASATASFAASALADQRFGRVGCDYMEKLNASRTMFVVAI